MPIARTTPSSARFRAGLCAGVLFGLVACDSQRSVEVKAVDEAATGFVFSVFQFDIPEATEGSCPQGHNLGVNDYKDKGMNVPFDCENPAGHEGPALLTLQGTHPVPGLDLDGSLDADTRRSTVCPHEEFMSVDGKPGVDNQFWRTFGCIRGFQKGDGIDLYTPLAIRTGSLTILMEVMGLDDRVNDPEVEVRIYSSEESVPLNLLAQVDHDGSLLVHPDKRFHSDRFPGYVKEGVLYAGPVDFRLELKVQVVDSEFYFRDAVFELEFLPDGGARGTMGGYWDVASVYDVMGGHGQARAASQALGFTCPALYDGLHAMADGHKDPSTGNCTSLSTAMRLEAVPAFVIHPQEDVQASR